MRDERYIQSTKQRKTMQVSRSGPMHSSPCVETAQVIPGFLPEVSGLTSETLNSRHFFAALWIDAIAAWMNAMVWMYAMAWMNEASVYVEVPCKQTVKMARCFWFRVDEATDMAIGPYSRSPF